MAADSFECKIITGGFNHVDNSWDITNDELNRCFKIYHPIKGDAVITIDKREYRVEAGNIYFISGFDIEAQRCDDFMDVYWLHFVPASLQLSHILRQAEPVTSWPDKVFPYLSEFNRIVYDVFGIDDYEVLKTSALPYSFREAKLYSYLLDFVAHVLQCIPEEKLVVSREYLMLEPAIKYMNNEYKENPSLEEIAYVANLAPNYFHRIFKAQFGLTPYEFMLHLRMEHAIKLLTTTNKSVKEVAFESGYKNEFYFQRQFKRLYKYTPGKLKKLRPF
ncbi:AraC family transcriptional regulator [Puteibacter caeruleilacunae]|nr:AraC family transcriptional regulator [Puteibacter caeruleilacunae]